MRDPIARRVVAEAAGTALLVGIGTGTVVAAARVGGIPGTWMAMAWFLAVLIPIVLFIRLSGAHLNPIVTLGLAASGRIDWKELPPYIFGQFVGAFLGSGVVLATLGDHGNLGATVPAGGDVVRAFPAELAFTALLVGTVFFLADRGRERGVGGLCSRPRPSVSPPTSSGPGPEVR